MSILNFVLVLFSTVTATQLTYTQERLQQKQISEAEDFLKGFIEGVLDSQILTLANCEVDAIFELQQVKNIVMDLVHMEDRAALQDLEDMVKVLPKIAEKCQTAYNDNNMMNDF